VQIMLDQWMCLCLVLLMQLHSAACLSCGPQNAPSSRRSWLSSGAQRTAAAVATVASITSIVHPQGATAAATAEAKPVVEVLVQLEEGMSLAVELSSNPGAMLYVTASEEEDSTPLLGAKVALDAVTLPALLQLYPANMLGGAKWENLKLDTLVVSIKVVAAGQSQQSKALLQGVGSTKYLTELGDLIKVPMWLPAFVVLEPAKG
jgi:hypothetical protein